MGIGSSLLNKENLELVGKNSWKFGRPQIVDLGMRYYEEHPADVERIAKNLEYMGLPSRGAGLDEVLREIAVHYYEKLFILTKQHEAYWIGKNRIEMGDSVEILREAQAAGKAIFIGQSHFGGTYLMGLTLTVRGFDINVVGKFPEPVNTLLDQNGAEMKKRHPECGTANLINLVDRASDAPVQMLRCLNGKKILSNVYDENNQFCKEVSLLGRPLMGGTGMDLFLDKFDDERVLAVTAFLVRTGEDTFRYELDTHSLGAGSIVDSFYRSLEKRVRDHHAQWYFIHELHDSFPPGT